MPQLKVRQSSFFCFFECCSKLFSSFNYFLLASPVSRIPEITPETTAKVFNPPEQPINELKRETRGKYSLDALDSELKALEIQETELDDQIYLQEKYKEKFRLEKRLKVVEKQMEVIKGKKEISKYYLI